MKNDSRLPVLIRSTALALLVLLLAGTTSLLSAATLASNGTQADVAAKIAAAVNGDIVTLPAGSFTWTSGLIVSGKGIKLQGAGAGRIVGRSASSVAIGTGSKTFTLITESVPAIAALKSAITPGTVLKCAETCHEGNYVQGTVTSLNGTTLTMDITSTGGSGTPSLWVISTPASTTIVHNAGSTDLVTTNESVTGPLEIAGIRFSLGTGTGAVIHHSAVLTGKPLLLHDCYFDLGAGSSGIFVRISTNRGIIYNCSFSASSGFVQSNAVCIQQKDASNIDASASGSWTRASTMGMSDTSGTSNLYVEDCDIHGFAEAVDADDNGRIVVRSNLLDNAGMGTHGADTSTYGVRHYEFYNNEFSFANRDALTFNLSHWLYFRGGTGVATDNVMPDISSMMWGNKPEIRIQVQNLRRSAGPHPLWGAAVAGYQYPAPRQCGMGRVSGVASSDAYTYNGDSEPFYQWNNTGGGACASPSIENYAADDGTGTDDISGYVQVGRDFINSAKPNYTKYTYPHPLRSLSVSTTSDTLNAPTNARVLEN